MSVIIMVDSCANITKSMIKKHGLSLLPYNVVFNNGDCYKDVIDIKNQEQLLSLIDSHDSFPKIDQISMSDIETCFRKIIESGDDILYIGVSSKLSGAYNEVLEVSKKFDKNTIEIIDSLNAGCGQTLLAMYAKDYVDKGYGLKQTARYLNQIKHNVKSFYTVNDASYLYKQRRCEDILDDYMRFYRRVPIAQIDKGKIVLTFKGYKDDVANQIINDTILDYSRNIDTSHMVISYSGDRTRAIKLKQKSSKLFSDINVSLVENSSSVYMNTGNNSLSVAFLVNKS